MTDRSEIEVQTAALQSTPKNRADQRAGLGLGYFSLGLGLTELLAPSVIARLLGTSTRGPALLLIRAFGARELISGLGLLSKPSSPRWLWSRVAGDAMDLALLGKQLASRRSNRNGALFATAAVAGVTALDALSAARASR